MSFSFAFDANAKDNSYRDDSGQNAEPTMKKDEGQDAEPTNKDTAEKKK